MYITDLPSFAKTFISYVSYSTPIFQKTVSNLQNILTNAKGSSSK